MLFTVHYCQAAAYFFASLALFLGFPMIVSAQNNHPPQVLENHSLTHPDS
jgi:hypothetical protein